MLTDRAIFEAAPSPMVLINNEGVVVDRNRRAAVELPALEIGRSVASLWAPGTHPAWDAWTSSEDEEATIDTPGIGAMRWSRLSDADQATAIGTLAPRAANPTEERLSAITGYVPGVVFSYVLERDGRRTTEFIGSGASRLLLADDEISDFDDLFKRVHPDDLERLQQAAAEAVHTNAELDHEFRLRDAAGHHRWVRTLSSGVHIGDGRMRWHGLVLDLTPQREVSRQLEFALEAGRLGVWDWNPIADVTTRSDQYARNLRLEPDAIRPPWTWSRALHPDDRQRAVGELYLHLEKQTEAYAAEYRIRGGDGWCWIRDTGRIFERDADGNVTRIVGIQMNIDAERSHAAETERLRHQLAHINRVNSLGEASSRLAHELNQPLTAINNYAETLRSLLSNGTDDHARTVDILDRISRLSLQGGAIVSRARALIGRNTTERVMIDLADVIDEAVSFVESQALDQEVRIVTDCATDCRFFGDAVELMQVFVNLLTNAIDACTRGGRIDTGCRRIAAGIEVAVSDTGRGLDPERLKTIFEPFQSSRPGGVGLGLSISRSIVEAHGGRISARPRTGGGTVFEILFPEAPPA